MNLQIKTVSGTSLSNAVILTAIYVLINDLCFQIFGNIVEYSSQWLTLNSYLLFGCLFFSPFGFPILFSCLCPRRICIFLHGCRLWNTRWLGTVCSPHIPALSGADPPTTDDTNGFPLQLSPLLTCLLNPFSWWITILQSGNSQGPSPALIIVSTQTPLIDLLID